MFTDLLRIVELVREAASGIVKLGKAAERRSAALEMLKTYFLILDAHEDGLRLLESATADPISYVKQLGDKTLETQLKIWDTILRRQSWRLYEASNYVSAQSYLAVIDPDAQKSINEVIGYKMDRVATLHGLGASLFFRSIFPLDESPESVAELVIKVLATEESGAIDQIAVREELARLKKGLDAFRESIMGLIDKEEFHSIAEEARNATRLHTPGA